MENKVLGWEMEYPRPQMKRESWLNLCGEWEITVTDRGEEKYIGKIKVPFAPESYMSGIEKALCEGEKWVYRKSFSLPENFNKGRVFIHFGAVDCIAKVKINNVELGRHEGGYIPFSFDITKMIQKENTIELIVSDETDTDFCYGKQSKKRGGMWYTPISGIWQTVWLESVVDSYVKSLKITPTLDTVTIETVGGDANKTVIIEGKAYTYNGDVFTVKIDNPVLWSPERAHLYEFTLIAGNDRIESYFALRSIECKNGGVCLNNKPYYFHGVLDQGYYQEGIFTPGSPAGYIEDILTMKRLGFNTLRKHVKIEPDIFYYYCDKYGMIVFQDMVNSGEYHYITDTVIPTLGIKKSRDDKPSDRRRQHFEKTLKDMALLLYNHPSVCLYTIFNEGWGQYDADRLYEIMKSFDKTRLWNTTSGWFKKKKSDVDSEHVYFRSVKLKRKGERPLLLTEFGGYSCKIEGHSFNKDKEYGYKKLKSCEEFMRELEKLYKKEIVPSVENGLCASILTQLSDVEDETNGLITYDRQLLKVDEKRMNDIAKELQGAFKKHLTLKERKEKSF